MKKLRNKNVQAIRSKEIAALSDYLKVRYLQDHRPLFTFLSGSIVEGLSTPNSDYDIYAVYEECEEREVILTDFSRPVEVTSIKLSKLVGIFELVRRGKDLVSLSPYELLLCHRVHSGICLTGFAAFQKLENLLDAQTFRHRLSDLCFLYAERSLKVCSGNLLVNDNASALLNANHALRQTFNRLLAVSGATSLLEKWQLAYGSRYLGQEHPAYKEFIRLMSTVPYENMARSQDYIDCCFRFQQVVCDYIRYVANGFNDFNWESRLSSNINGDANMLLRKAALSRVVEAEGKFYLFLSTTPILELPEEAADLWAFIDNDTSVLALSERSKNTLKLTPVTFAECLNAFSSVNVLAISNFRFEHYKD